MNKMTCNSEYPCSTTMIFHLQQQSMICNAISCLQNHILLLVYLHAIQFILIKSFSKYKAGGVFVAMLVATLI